MVLRLQKKTKILTMRTVYIKNVTECIGIECLLLKEDTFSSRYNKTITVQAVGNLVQYMTFTLDDIEEVMNEERYQKFISYAQNYYDTINEALIRSSIGVRRNTTSLTSRNSQSSRMENSTSAKVVKKIEKTERRSVQGEAGKFRRRRSVMVMRKSITEKRNERKRPRRKMDHQLTMWNQNRRISINEEGDLIS